MPLSSALPCSLELIHSTVVWYLTTYEILMFFMQIPVLYILIPMRSNETNFGLSLS